MICPYCGAKTNILYSEAKKKNLPIPEKPFGNGFLTLACPKCYFSNEGEQKTCFITPKPFTDKYALGSLREPKTFSSHTAWENHANKMNPGAYVNHKE